MSLYAAIEKIESADDGTIKVYGVASSEAEDNDGETIKAAAMRGAIPDYMRFPAIREMHKLDAAGRALEVDCGDDGITRVVAHIVDPVAVEKVKKQVYSGFSIGGRALERDPHNRKVITKMSLHEISLVDRPCNPEAVFDLWKVDDASEGEASEEHAGGTFSEPTNPAGGINSYDLEGQKKKKPVSKRDFNQKERDAAAKSGAAMEGGSFPIKNQGDLDNAVRLRGNGKHSKASVEAHIRRRAKALGLKVPEMSDTEKVEGSGAGPTMGELLELASGNESMGELLAKAETTPPDGSAKPVTDSEHSANEEDGDRPGRVGTPAERPAGSSHSVDPGAPSLQSTNQNFGAGVSRATDQALHEGPVEGGSSVPSHGTGAAGEGLKKGMGTIACLANMLCEIKCMLVGQRYEEAMEDDSSPIVAQLGEWLRTGATLLGSVVSHEVQELLADANVDPGDMGGMIELVAKTIRTMQQIRKADKPAVDADTGGKHEMDADDDDEGKAEKMDKVEKVAAPADAHNPDDLAKIAKLEAQLAEHDNQPIRKGIAGPAKTVTKAQDTVSGFAEATADDAALMKAFQAMSDQDQKAMVFKSLLSRPTAIINPAGQ